MPKQRPKNVLVEPSRPLLAEEGEMSLRNVGRRLRVGAVNNPLSGQNLKKGSMQTVLDVLSAHPEVLQHGGQTLEDIRDAAAHLCREGVEILVVNGGDGTVQAALTGMFSQPPAGRLPLLLLLPGGTTNMIAMDIGVPKERPAATLDRFLNGAKEGRVPADVVQRPVIRMQRGDRAPIFGMFFGAGAIYHGINFCRRWLYRVGLKGEIGPGVAMSVFILQAVLGKREAVIPPLHAAGRIDHEMFDGKEYHALMVSTLEHLFLRIRPFWGGGNRPLKLTGFSVPVRHAWRVAIPILRGRPNRYVRPENGYESCTAREIELRIDSGFTLDGELFEPEPDLPVLLDGERTAGFLRLDRA